MATVTNALVPLVSVLIGAGLTYWLNVRGRRHQQVEDLFDAAIAAVAVADASKHYLASVGRPEPMPEQEYRQMIVSLNRTAIENHTKRTAEAREAIARVVRFEPQLARFYRDAEALIAEPDEILRLLNEARVRHI